MTPQVQLGPPGARRYRWYGLFPTSQADFSGGMFQSVAPHLIPPNGVRALRNGLLEEGGSIYRRGGSTYRSTSAFGTGLTFLWDGILAGGARTIIANATDFGRLNADGSVTNLAGGGLTVPKRAVAYQGKLFIGGGTTYDGTTIGSAARTSDHYAIAGGRLLSGEGARVYESDRGAPATFGSTNFQELPGGVEILGVEGLRNVAAIFTTGGVWILNNVHLDLVDANGNPQQTLDHYSHDLVLWADTGLAGWDGSLIVPGIDAVWLLSFGVTSEAPAAFRRLSDPITNLYRGYVTGGYRPGQATVHEGTYLLPIIDTNGNAIDLLACRLQTGGWSRLDGYGANLTGVTAHLEDGQAPVLMGAGATGRMLNLDYFTPSAAVKADADGSVYTWQVVSRDFPTGGLNQDALVRRARVWYELVDASVDFPTLEAAFGSGAPRIAGATWGSFLWGYGTLWEDSEDAQLINAAGEAPEDPQGVTPFVWQVGRRGRFVRWRLTCSKPAASLKLRSVEMFARASGRR